MKILKNQVLKNVAKRSIVYDIYYDEKLNTLPIVLFCHGYKGFKDWGVWHLVAQKFAAAGFFFLKFNFSHNGGTVSNPIDFPDLDAFANNNFTLELDDIERVLKMVTTQSLNEHTDCDKVYIIGHSRGGGTALLKAESNKKIKKIATWASVSDFGARFKTESDEFKKWRESGITYVENSRTKQQMPHYFQFFENYKKNEKALSLNAAAQNLKIPYLIIHGDADTTVRVEEAKALHNWNTESILEVLANADHVFGASHPWEKEDLPNDLQKVVDLTIQFFK